MSQSLSFSVILEPQEDGGFTVLVPALPEVVTEGDTEEEALANGAFAFIRKPVALDELARFVVLALQSRKAQPTI